MRLRQQESTTCGMKMQSQRKFFDLKKEYSTVHRNSDDDDDEMSDATTTGVTANEDGYSSDISNASTMLQDHLHWKENRKSRKTRQVLNSNRNSVIVDYASDTDVPTLQKQQRKRKVKTNRLSKHVIASDSKEVLTAPKKSDDDSQKRRSWTDSGVSLSLSRTDHSRCGTFENDVTTNTRKNKEHFNHLKSKSATNFLKPNDMNNEKEADDQIYMNSIPVRRRSSTCSRTDCKKMNRLSQITNRSSLTNVTILTANSMSSLSSMITPSELEYITSDNSMDEENDVTSTLHSTVPRETEICKGSQCSVASDSNVANGMGNSRTSIETTVAVDLNHIEKDMNFNHRNNPISVKSLDTKSKIILDSTKKPVTDPNRKRSKSLLSSFKRVKQHLRPRFFSEKSYKDVSSDFSFEKARNNNESETLLQSNTTDVLMKLEKLQEEEESNNHLQNVSPCFIDYDSIDEDDIEEESESDILEKLSSPPVKEKGFFLGKIFKRSSKSYSTTNVEKKNKKHLSPLNRSSISRASVRSNPENLSNSNSRHSYYEETCNDDYHDFCNDTFCECDQDMSRARSMNFICEELPYLRKPRSNSTPTTPMLMRNIQGLNSIENQCSCDECLYADYLDFLEYQRFRRYANYTPYNYYPGSHEVLPTQDGNSSSPCENKKEEIIAPLMVTVATDKEAKTFRTSKYESFV